VWLRRLSLINFRNYPQLDLRFSKGINLITGANAQGKTNLLEAIHFLCTCKSHRTHLDDEMIRHGEDGFYLKGIFEEEGEPFTIEISTARDGRKRAKLDGKPVQKLSEIIGTAKAVIFSSESMEIVKGPPSERRKFMDVFISQMDKVYLYDLQSYQSALRQRNELLRQIREGEASEELLEVWDEQIAHYGSRIVRRRIEAVEKLASFAVGIYEELAGDPTLRISYLVNGEGPQTVNSSASLSDLLLKFREIDISRGSTSVGPHRDDLSISLGGADVRRFCSQGQQRLIALSLKLAELEMMTVECGVRPILLLDDAASELDRERRGMLKRVLSGLKNTQIFITATHPDEIELEGEAALFEVEGGQVRWIG